jgi:hypothetical protein
MNMHFAIAALFALCLNMQAIAQNTQEEPKFYKVSIVELALPADADLPFSLDAEISPDEILRNDKFTRKQTVQLSVLEGRRTSALFQTSIKLLTGMIERDGKKMRSYTPANIGSLVRITAKQTTDDSVLVNLTYQASRIDGEPKEDEPTDISKTDLSMDVQVRSGKPKLLLTKSSADKIYIMLMVTPE